MPSTNSLNLRLELQATGENANTWGVKTNANLNLIEAAITSYVTVSISAGDTVLTASNYTADQARAAGLELQGTLTAAVSIVVPAVPKAYFFNHVATGAFDVRIVPTGAAGVVIPPGRTSYIFVTSVTAQIMGGGVFVSGTATKLGLWNPADPDTGIYQPAANRLGIVAGGTKIIDVGVSGIGIRTTPTSAQITFNNTLNSSSNILTLGSKSLRLYDDGGTALSRMGIDTFTSGLLYYAGPVSGSHTFYVSSQPIFRVDPNNIQMAAGTSLTPSLALLSQSNTGLNYVNNAMGLIVQGVELVNVSSENLTVRTSLAVFGKDAVVAGSPAGNKYIELNPTSAGALGGAQIRVGASALNLRTNSQTTGKEIIFDGSNAGWATIGALAQPLLYLFDQVASPNGTIPHGGYGLCISKNGVYKASVAAGNAWTAL